MKEPGKQDPETSEPPRWLTPFFFVAGFAALAALVLVFLLHDAGRADLEQQPIADLTINLGGQPVREHCTTCHPGGSRPDPADLPSSRAPHPAIAPHRIDQLGCTACHLGEGMALDLEISHGLPGSGGRDILTGEDLQASCFRCHPPGPLPGGEEAWQGYQQFFAKACNTCHVFQPNAPGGYYGPDLIRIGTVFGLAAIQEAIREPRKAPVNSTMPRFPLSKKQVRQVSYFLKSLRGTPLYATPLQMQSGRIEFPQVDLVPTAPSLSAGERHLFRQQCLGCHKFGSYDGRIAPDLTYLGDQRSADDIRTFLLNPARLVPGSAMPGIPLEERTTGQLVTFLSEQAIGPVPAATGMHLYMQLCQRCHAAGGNGFGPIQPNLTRLPRAFADNAAFFHAVDDQRLIASLKNGIPGTSMPAYGRLLDTARLETLLDLIFAAFIGIERDEKIRQPPPPELSGILPGRAQIDAVYAENCQRCHGRFGSGKGTDYLEYLPRPRNLRNQPYFAALTDRRLVQSIHGGVPGTAMPAFRDHLEDRQIQGLVGKVRAFSGTEKP